MVVVVEELLGQYFVQGVISVFKGICVVMECVGKQEMLLKLYSCVQVFEGVEDNFLDCDVLWVVLVIQ